MGPGYYVWSIAIDIFLERQIYSRRCVIQLILPGLGPVRMTCMIYRSTCFHGLELYYTQILHNLSLTAGEEF